jgi:hypothetical protein
MRLNLANMNGMDLTIGKETATTPNNNTSLTFVPSSSCSEAVMATGVVHPTASAASLSSSGNATCTFSRTFPNCGTYFFKHVSSAGEDEEDEDDDASDEPVEEKGMDDKDDEDDMEKMQKQLDSLKKQLADTEASISKSVQNESEARLRKMGFREETGLQAPKVVNGLGVDGSTPIQKSTAIEDTPAQLAELSYSELRRMQHQIDTGNTDGVPRELLG